MPVRMPGRVSVEENVAFGTGGGRALHCDVYLPPDHAPVPEGADGGPAVVGRAAILLLHGGGWMNGDRAQLRGYGIQLARYGFVCVCPEYRLSGESTWPAQVHDVKAALRWLRANAGRLGVDATRISVSGNSAGAHLALMLGALRDGELEGEGGHAGVSTQCAAVVAIYPPTQLRVTHPDDPIGRLLGGNVAREVEDQASPLAYARADFPPTMLVHGNADSIVPVQASLEMYSALAKAGAAVEMHIYDGVPHAFDTDVEFGRQVTDLIALFIDRKVCRAG